MLCPAPFRFGSTARAVTRKLESKGDLMSKTRIAVIFISTITMTVTIYTGLVLATPSTGSSTLIGRGTYDEFKIKREMPGLELDLKARTDIAIATQIITFQKGTDSGWHNTPAPVFITG